MTSERAAYHRLMLLAGLSEEYEQELDHALEAEDPIPAPELDLALCMSNLNQTVSILYNYSMDHPVDQQQVYDMIMGSLRRQYAEKHLTAAQLVKIMYTIAQNCENNGDDLWDPLRYPSYEYDLVEDGLISEEVFNIAFGAAFLHGEHLDVWQLQKAHQQKKKKSILDFRKQK